MKRKERKRLNKRAKAQLTSLTDRPLPKWMQYYYEFANNCDTVIKELETVHTKPEDLMGYPTPYSWYRIKWSV
jgi:hypothetical protein